VSDVFYVHYDDGDNVDLIYMDSPTNDLWPSVIEKAYAVKFGGYGQLDDAEKHPVEEYWRALMGAEPRNFSIDGNTNLERIRTIARAASRVPTIGASRDTTSGSDVARHHGFAILGMAVSNIKLYNPHGETIRLSPEVFRDNFKALVYGSP
jgi:hypothetical protein